MKKTHLYALVGASVLSPLCAQTSEFFDFDNSAQDSNFTLNRANPFNTRSVILASIANGGGDRQAYDNSPTSRSVQLLNGSSTTGTATLMRNSSIDMSIVGASARISVLANHHRTSQVQAQSMSQVDMVQLGLHTLTDSYFVPGQPGSSLFFANGQADSTANAVSGSGSDTLLFNDLYFRTHNPLTDSTIIAESNVSEGFQTGAPNQGTLGTIWWGYDVEYTAIDTIGDGLVDSFLTNLQIDQITGLEVGNVPGNNTTVSNFRTIENTIVDSPFTQSELGELHLGIGRSALQFRVNSATFYDNLTLEYNPTPEPSSMLALAIAGLAGVTRRKR